MIDRHNYQLAKQFLAYLRDVTQIDPVSVERYWIHLKQLLLWADDVPFNKCAEKRPTFAAHLASRQESKTKPIASLTVKKIFQTTKRFFTWAKTTHARDFRAVPLDWIEALRLPRAPENPTEHEFVKLAEVQRLAALEIDPSDLALQRDQAAAVMLFLSGMRAGAFTSMTIECVDLPNRTIRQWTSLGIKTKNSKSATTYLLDIPDLIAIVKVGYIHPRSTTWDSTLVSADYSHVGTTISFPGCARREPQYCARQTVAQVIGSGGTTASFAA